MKTIIILVILTFFYSCTSSREVIEKEENLSAKSNPYDESFDPNTLKDDDIIIVGDESPSQQSDMTLNAVEPDVQITETNGYRIQIIATKSIEAASQAELEAKDIFESLNHKVYLIFDAPNYKVRIGDVINRNEADEIRDIAKDYGYRGAFVVRSKVNVQSQ
jgi:hypothetical protein